MVSGWKCLHIICAFSLMIDEANNATSSCKDLSRKPAYCPLICCAVAVSLAEVCPLIMSEIPVISYICPVTFLCASYRFIRVCAITSSGNSCIEPCKPPFSLNAIHLSTGISVLLSPSVNSLCNAG